MRIAILCGLMAVCCVSAAPAPKPDTAPEVKWARSVADDFWHAIFEGEEMQAGGLCTPEMVMAHKGRDGRQEGLLGHGFEWYSSNYSNWAVAIDSEELSPDRAEVVFRGQLAGKKRNSESDRLNLDFKMRMVRQGPSGAWFVRFVLVTERKDEKGKN